MISILMVYVQLLTATKHRDYPTFLFIVTIILYKASSLRLERLAFFLYNPLRLAIIRELDSRHVSFPRQDSLDFPNFLYPSNPTYSPDTH